MVLVDTVTLGEIDGSRIRSLDIDTGTWSVVAVIDDDTEIVVSDWANETEAEAAIQDVADLLASEGDVFPSLILQDLAVLGTLRTALAGKRWEIGTEDTNTIHGHSGHPDETSPSEIVADTVDLGSGYTSGFVRVASPRIDSEDDARASIGLTTLKTPAKKAGMLLLSAVDEDEVGPAVSMDGEFDRITITAGEFEIADALPWQLPWGAIKRLVTTTAVGSITGTTTIFSHTLPTLPAGRLIAVHFTGNVSSTASGAASALIAVNGTTIVTDGSFATSSVLSQPFHSYMPRISSAVSGATITGRIRKDSGSGSTTYDASSTRAGYLLIEDIGPDPDA